MGTAEQVRELVAPLLVPMGLELFDVEHTGAVVRVLVDRDGGVDLDTLAEATRAVSAALDDADPLPGRYTLEVSSPGLERPLRRPEHFARSIGQTVAVKTVPGTEGERRLRGQLVAVDDDGITVRLDDAEERRVRFPAIDRARTVFEWGPAPKPGRPQTRKKAARS